MKKDSRASLAAQLRDAPLGGPKLLDQVAKRLRSDKTFDVFQRAIACAVLEAVRDGYDPRDMLGIAHKRGKLPTCTMRDYAMTARFLTLRAEQPDKPAKDHYLVIAQSQGFTPRGADAQRGIERVRKIVAKNRKRVTSSPEKNWAMEPSERLWIQYRVGMKALVKKNLRPSFLV